MSTPVTTVHAPGLTRVPLTPTPLPKTLTVCLSQEPASLMWSDSSPVTNAVLEAIDGGSIDTRSYGFQPVIFEKLPSFAEGDAARVEVKVNPGDPVVNARTGQVVPLAQGVALAQLNGDPVVYSGKPAAATTVQITASWTLVQGLTWHDGQPVTADDQVFMFETAKSPDLPTLKYLVERSASFTAKDERTTTWTGLPGFDDPNYFLNVWSPLPRHAYGRLTPAQMLDDEKVNRQPLGYGPFQLVEWQPGDHIRLRAARDTYWRAAEGLPHLDTLTFRFVDDPERLSAMLVSGECDVGTQDVPFENELAMLRKYEADGRLNIHVTASPVLENLSFAADPGPGYNGFAQLVKSEDGEPIFSDPVIRRAFAYCIDRQALVDGVLGGAAEVQDVYVPPNHPLYPADAQNVLAWYPFDPAKGLELLASRGWKDHDDDGVLDRLGQKFSITYAIRRNPTREAVSQAVQAQLLGNCGIKANVVSYGSEFMIAGPRGVVLGRQFDVSQLAWPVGPVPPCTLYASNQMPDRSNDWSAPNITGLNHPDFDAACSAALAAQDPAEAAEWHARAMRIFTEELPALPLYSRYKIVVSTSKLQGLLLDPTSGSELWNVESFDVVR